MSNKRHNTSSNQTTTEVIESLHEDINKTSENSNVKCPEYFQDDDRSRWLYWVYHFWKPWCLKNGSHELLFEGTINGRSLTDLKNANPCIFKITETVRNVATYEKYVKDPVYRTRLTQVSSAFRILMPILRKPIMVDDGHGGLVRQLLHPTARIAFEVANVPGMRRLIPGLSIPTAAELAAMSPLQQAQEAANYITNWGHVPRDNNAWAALVYPGAATDADCPPPLQDFDESEVLDEVMMTIYRLKRVSKVDLKREYEAAKVANPLFNFTAREFCERDQDPTIVNEIAKQWTKQDDSSKDSIKFIAVAFRQANLALDKIQGAPRDLVNGLIMQQRYPEVVQKLMMHHNTLELGNETQQEAQIANHTPIAGEAWISYKRNLVENCIALATQKKLASLVIAHGKTYVETYPLDTQEMADNCGNMTDAEFALAYPLSHRHVSEAKMVSYTIAAVMKFPRLQPVNDKLMTMDPDALNMRDLSILITNVEKNPVTKAKQKEEAAKQINNYKKQKLTEATTNVTLQDNGKLDNGKPRCRHPDHSQSNHTNPDCRLQFPNNKAAKGKGKKKQDNDTKQRKPPTWDPCRYCSSIPALKKNAQWHSDDRCTKNPASPVAIPGSIPQSVHVAHQVNSQLSPIMDQLAITTAAFVATSKTLKSALGVNKKRKPKVAFEDEEDDEDA